MTSILNKLVSACEKIEANAGSGGSSENDSTYMNQSINNLETYGSQIYVPICYESNRNFNAMFALLVNSESFYRYYIELYFTNDMNGYCNYKLYKNAATPSDSIDVHFAIVKYKKNDEGKKCIGIKLTNLSGLNSVGCKVLTVRDRKENDCHPNILKQSDISEEEEITNVQFVPVIPSA